MVDDSTSGPRYIPLPKSLWELRHRFPTVTRSVMLQCVRCHRWVSQPVTRSIPDVVQTCPAPVTTHTVYRTQRLQPQQQQWNEERKEQEQQQQQQQQQREQQLKEEVRDEWRSPRLRQRYEKVPDAVKPRRQQEHDEPRTEASYFIPNPANFTCQWVYCSLGDIWADMRERWLGELCVAMVGATNVEENGGGGGSSTRNNNDNSTSKGVRQRGLPPSQQERLNEELTKELHGRRSERLAKRLHNGLDVKFENSDMYENAAESSHSGRIAQHVNTLIHQDDAVVASFCWVSCDRCGKLRCVHQPFPGGAPFVCALAVNIGSCTVPESEGLSPVFGGGPSWSSTDDNTNNDRLGNLTLREFVEAESSVAVATPAATAATGRRAAKILTLGKRQGHRSSLSFESTIPLLRELTMALRKRALGVFVKNLMVIPQEVRAKREAVARASLIIDGGGGHTNPTSPGRENNGSPQREEHGRSTSNHTSIKQEEEEEEEVRQHQLRIEESKRNSKGGKNERTDAFCAKSPRPTTRLGCPPRHVEWELREDGGLHRIALVTNPPTVSPDGAANHKKPSSSLAQHQGRGQGGKYSNTTVAAETMVKPIDVVNVRYNGGNKHVTDSIDNEADTKPSIMVAPPEKVGLERESENEKAYNGSSRRVVGRKRSRNFEIDTYPNLDHNGVSASTIGASNPVAKDYNEKKVKGKKSQQKEEDVEVIHWVCCDVCNKWRIIPKKLPENTERWQCVMRGDGTSCSDTDDEIRMNDLEKQRKGRGRPRRVG